MPAPEFTLQLEESTAASPPGSLVLHIAPVIAASNKLNPFSTQKFVVLRFDKLRNTTEFAATCFNKTRSTHISRATCFTVSHNTHINRATCFNKPHSTYLLRATCFTVSHSTHISKATCFNKPCSTHIFVELCFNKLKAEKSLLNHEKYCFPRPLAYLRPGFYPLN